MLNTGSQNLVSTAGEPLPLATRQFFEARLGRDFSLVRIHHDPQAALLAQGHRARAFTLGQDIVFAENQYQPASRQGKWLLAHELAHVIQQGQQGRATELSSAPLSIQRETASPSPARDNSCAGWESDRESFTKRVAEQYVMDALGTTGRGVSLSCFSNNTVCIWTIQTASGTVSVAVSLAQMPGRVIARQVYVTGGTRCEYDYSCTKKGDLILRLLGCQ
jgi:hypothetical protein